MRLDAESIPEATVAQIEAALAARGAGRRVIALLEQDPRAGVRRLAVRERQRWRARTTENRRRRRMRDFETRLWSRGLARVAGVDEVGRGCLAGPVVAAAVILSPAAARAEALLELDDSKELDAATRARLAARVTELADGWAVARIEPDEIDRINILEASMKAMRVAVARLQPAPEHVLVDGARAPGSGLEETAVIDGDALCLSIAPASVVAKEHRDALMRAYDREYPEYGFASNKGYASAGHRAALERLGPCPLHRRSFAPLTQRDQLRLELDGATGRRGERVAAEHLRRRGYRILQRSYRAAGGELDLVATGHGCCVFVEVKTTDRGGRPEERVGARKRGRLIRCARQFLARYPVAAETRFDVIAVDLSRDPPLVEHLEDAFPADL